MLASSSVSFLPDEKLALKMLNIEKKDDFFCLLFPAMALFSLVCSQKTALSLLFMLRNHLEFIGHRIHGMQTPPRILTVKLKWMFQIDRKDLFNHDIIGEVKLGQSTFPSTSVLDHNSILWCTCFIPNFLMVPFGWFKLREFDTLGYCILDYAIKDFLWLLRNYKRH